MENDEHKGTQAYINNINQLFKRPVSYLIPQFQRPYAWKEKEQWEPLWKDVLSVANRCLKEDTDGKIRPHFLGAIVLQHRESRMVTKTVVVDGQQRLTTLQLLIKATQQVFQQMDDIERAARLRELIENPSHLTTENTSNWAKILQSNISDQRVFQEAIEGSFSTERRDHWPITQSFLYFKKEVEAWLHDHDEVDTSIARANALEKALTKYIQIAVIDLAKDEDAHVIFETLNARGEPLTQSDLVKNTIMYKADVVENRQKAEELWGGMFDGDRWWRKDTGEPQLKRIQLDRFLNHWMIMTTRRSVAPERVAAEFRTFLEHDENHNAAPDIDIVAKGIRTSGKTYKEIMEGKEELLGDLFLKRMRAIGIMGSITPFLLWLRKSDVPSDHLRRCIKVLESYLVRRMLYGSGSQGLSTLFIDLLQNLSQKSHQPYVITISNHLHDAKGLLVWPNDRMLLERINGRPMPQNQARRKMVLDAIERELRGDKSEPLGSTDTLTIEHIMPQKWGKHYPLPAESSSQENLERRNEHVNYLGNLTLTTSRLNTTLSNAPWNEKQETLDKHSTLFLNKDLLRSAPPEWNEVTIRDRTECLTQKIIEIWKPADYFLETSDSLGDS